MVAFSVNKMGNCDIPGELYSIAVWVNSFVFNSTVLSSRIVSTFACKLTGIAQAFQGVSNDILVLNI